MNPRWVRALLTRVEAEQSAMNSLEKTPADACRVDWPGVISPNGLALYFNTATLRYRSVIHDLKHDTESHPSSDYVLKQSDNCAPGCFNPEHAHWKRRRAPRKTRPEQSIDNTVLNILQRADGALTAKQIAERLSEKVNRIYAVLNRLQKQDRAQCIKLEAEKRQSAGPPARGWWAK